MAVTRVAVGGSQEEGGGAGQQVAKRINAILYGTTVLYNLEKNVMYMILPFPFRENVF